MTARGVLSDVFGYSDFRPGQADAVDALVSGRDATVLLPTGAGKSLCYQVPALVAARQGRGTTIVVSPLIALMDDQVGALGVRSPDHRDLAVRFRMPDRIRQQVADHGFDFARFAEKSRC